MYSTIAASARPRPCFDLLGVDPTASLYTPLSAHESLKPSGNVEIFAQFCLSSMQLLWWKRERLTPTGIEGWRRVRVRITPCVQLPALRSRCDKFGVGVVSQSGVVELKHRTRGRRRQRGLQGPESLHSPYPVRCCCRVVCWSQRCHLYELIVGGRWVSLMVLACARRCCCGTRLGICDSIVPRSRFVT